MGAATFMNVGSGVSAKEAFAALVEQSRIEDGSSYSGCIGMKSSFKTVECPKGREPREYANSILDDDDDDVFTKDGPAGCIRLEDGRWLFFGWARE